jgi:hypothetical protein
MKLWLYLGLLSSTVYAANDIKGTVDDMNFNAKADRRTLLRGLGANKAPQDVFDTCSLTSTTDSVDQALVTQVLLEDCLLDLENKHNNPGDTTKVHIYITKVSAVGGPSVTLRLEVKEQRDPSSTNTKDTIENFQDVDIMWDCENATNY